LDILNDNMVGFANTSAREMLDHLFLTDGSITAVDLDKNMRKAWDPQQQEETLFKKIQDCVDYAESGGITIGPVHQINMAYAQIFATGSFTSACHRWNEKEAAYKTWTNFKIHFAAEHRQHKQMQGKSAANYGYHAANAAVGQTEDQMADATIGALANLATATATDHVVVATSTEANARLARKLEERSNEVKEVESLLKKERAERRGKQPFPHSLDNYCWSHGYKAAKSPISQNCNFPKDGHTREATTANNMGGC
jgi:hypothetical protein